jgi:predicted MPP superfamily phosphohydrolase
VFYFVILLLIALIGGANYYLAHRVWSWVRCFVPTLSIAVPLAFFAVMAVFMVLSFVKPFSGVLQRCISFVGNVWMGAVIYFLIFFLLSDLAVLVVGLFQVLSESAMARLRLIAGISATALALTVSAYGVFNARRIRTVEYDIELSAAPTSNLCVALISDVHIGALGSESKLPRIVEEINALKPDIVCIAGDIFDSNFTSIADPQAAIDALKRINSTYGVYACLGNHDAGATFASMEDFLTRAQIKLLKDESVVIDGRLVLAGRLDSRPIGNAGALKRGDIASVLKGVDPSLPVVVMDHNPANADEYHGEVDLLLSGHTHKGQVFPASLITSAMYTVDYGYYRAEDGMHAVVSSGIGTWGPPLRVGSNCEIVKLDLKF